jgi:hypothetical protein
MYFWAEQISLLLLTYMSILIIDLAAIDTPRSPLALAFACGLAYVVWFYTCLPYLKRLFNTEEKRGQKQNM